MTTFHHRILYTPVSLILLLGLSMASCKSPGPKELPPPEIPVTEVIQKDVPIYREFVGQVYGEKDIPIRARVEGFLEGIHFQEGTQVAKGQLLYTIDPLPFQAQVNAKKSLLAEAETMMVKAKSDLDRYIPLAKSNAVSQSDLDAAQAQYDASLSSVDAAKANLRSAEIELGYCKIYSPIHGIIGKTLAREGDFVGREPNPVILNTVSKTNEVKVNFFLTESEYLTISRAYRKDIKDETKHSSAEDQKVEIQLILSDGTVYNHKGKVDFVDRGIDATTGTILIQSSFPNPDLLLRPGLFAKVKVKMKQEKGGLIIPQRCVMELQGQYSVYVVKDDNTVEARPVEIGPTAGEYWIIKDGLKAKEKVVLEGIQKVRSGMLIKPLLTEFKSQAQQ